VKAELIQHFVAKAVTGHSISSQVLTELINDTQKTVISSRTIRWHMNKLGLMKIKKSLPELVEALKKTPDADNKCGGGFIALSDFIGSTTHFKARPSSCCCHTYK
jgi:hypothetical protein